MNVSTLILADDFKKDASQDHQRQMIGLADVFHNQ
jgi:hypothetical protein